jgi:hypothetical protein
MEEKPKTIFDSSIMRSMMNNLIDTFIDELKNDENKERIMQDVIAPILDDIDDRYFPLMMSLLILLSIIIILLLFLLIVNARCYPEKSV